jgi:hypothetical protein
MVEFLKFVFSNFWMWLGFVIVVGMILNFIFKVYNRTLRQMNIRKHGYPENCNADGDFLQIKDEDSDDDGFSIKVL